MQTGKTHTVYAHPSWTVGNLMWSELMHVQ